MKTSKILRLAAERTKRKSINDAIASVAWDYELPLGAMFVATIAAQVDLGLEPLFAVRRTSAHERCVALLFAALAVKDMES
jgi:hypothetical protein